MFVKRISLIANRISEVDVVVELVTGSLKPFNGGLWDEAIVGL